MKRGNRESGIGNRQGAPASASRFSESPIPNSQSRQQGFSLLEVIAAILLLAIAFTALMKVAGASIQLTHNAAEHSQAAMRARSLLDSAFVGEPVKPGSRSGRFDEQYRWQLDVTPWSATGPVAAGAPLQLYQLDLTVTWGPQAHPRTAHFRTLRLGGSSGTNLAQASP